MRFFFALLLLFHAMAIHAQQISDENVRAAHFNASGSVAINGYDPVSYFEGKPMKGKPEIGLAYKGTTHQFASQANLNKFKLSPEKYKPAYGSWPMSWATKWKKVKVDPYTCKIHEGSLYLFYNFWGNNTPVEWNNEQKLIVAGDQYWMKLMKTGHCK